MEREKIIREDYPVEKLPEDLRAAVGDAERVTVILEADDSLRSLPAEERRRRWIEIKALIDKARAHPGFKPVTAEEAVARIRALRDEWDD